MFVQNTLKACCLRHVKSDLIRAIHMGMADCLNSHRLTVRHNGRALHLIMSGWRVSYQCTQKSVHLNWRKTAFQLRCVHVIRKRGHIFISSVKFPLVVTTGQVASVNTHMLHCQELRALEFTGQFRSYRSLLSCKWILPKLIC
ncbi:hypothetical protein J6590_012733 [Homalodisca vitripennis]|nr:hypothetical protein J6590_012733 [Homalodisca vitripennis]